MPTARKTSGRGTKSTGTKKKKTPVKKTPAKKTTGQKKTPAKKAAASRGRAPSADPGTPQGGPRPWTTESGEATLAGQDLTPESGRWPYRGQAQEEQESGS